MMRHNTEKFLPEGSSQVEWSLSGWAFPSVGMVWTGFLELAGVNIGSLAYGWPRPDVLAAFPGECKTEDTGFTAQCLLPAGLKAGNHELILVFLDEKNQELGRVQQPFSLTADLPDSQVEAAKPMRNLQGLAKGYVDLLEKTILGLPYVDTKQALARSQGLDWPENGHSMIGQARMRTLRDCVETVLLDEIPGDLIETGVWKGGSCILMRGILFACDNSTRKVWVADSFAGLPPPNVELYPADLGDEHYTFEKLAISLEQVQEHFRRYDLLDDQVKFLKGWFSETLPTAPIEQIAVLRLDGDMYESTMDALTSLYSKLSPGGFCIIDDYGAIPACRQAVQDYRKANDIHDHISMSDWTGAWWRKA